jgi:hypothetical protein
MTSENGVFAHNPGTELARESIGPVFTSRIASACAQYNRIEADHSVWQPFQDINCRSLLDGHRVGV